jgi:hypothetical protein
MIFQNSGFTIISHGTVARSSDPIRRFIDILVPSVVGVLKKIAA